MKYESQHQAITRLNSLITEIENKENQVESTKEYNGLLTILGAGINESKLRNQLKGLKNEYKLEILKLPL